MWLLVIHLGTEVDDRSVNDAARQLEGVDRLHEFLQTFFEIEGLGHRSNWRHGNHHGNSALRNLVSHVP